VTPGQRTTALAGVMSGLASALWLLHGCGSGNGGGFDGGTDGTTDDVGVDGATSDGLPQFSDGGDGCINLACDLADCGADASTTVTGAVYDPAGKLPLYDVIVYVPNAALQPFPDGTTCDTCGALVSGDPLTTALTGPDGRFTLTNVPVGTDVPLVMQVGKWRRQIKIPTVSACVDNPVGAKDGGIEVVTRLPRNQSEGEMPRIAIATGHCDVLECLVRKIGIDDAEFTAQGGTGRVHVYTGFMGGTVTGGTQAEALWDDPTTLAKYDVVMNSCECDPIPQTKPASAIQAMHDYTTKGGRIFASHYHYYWFAPPAGPADFNATAQWNVDQLPPPDPLAALVDQSFPKGKAFAEWLVNVGGSTTQGQITLHQIAHDVDGVNAPTQRWIYTDPDDAGNDGAVQYLTFNTPTDAPDAAAQCGRVVFSDLHVASNDNRGLPFPTGCITTDLSAQEQALEFMFFDLASCIIPDSQQPKPPPPK
jgi:hypothetical protein